MKYVNSGNGKVPCITLIAVLSVSLVINLPGLAVSPMLSQITKIFHAPMLESQLLTSLPNLCMIPVVIIAGILATPKRQTCVLAIGMSLFLLSGIFCFFAKTIGQLIFLSCTSGVGCGLVVPIAAGYISEWFSGQWRQKDLGLKSTVSNAMVIIANVYVGWIAMIHWRAAFVVYLIPIIPLLLIPFMTQKYVAKNREIGGGTLVTPAQTSQTSGPSDSSTALHFHGKPSLLMLIRLILLYMFLTYCTTSISYYSPFLMDHYGMSTAEVGVVTACYYLMCSVAGAFVAKLRIFFGPKVIFICLGLCAAGLITIGVTHSFGIYMLASLLTGFGYGIIQPIIYNKTTYVAPTRKLGTTYFGYVLSANYMGIMLVPYIDTFFRKLFKATSPGFEFSFSGIVVLLLLGWALLEHKNYVFAVDPTSSAPTPKEIAEADE